MKVSPLPEPALLFGIILGDEKGIYGILKTKKPATQARACYGFV
jgi:hypothetical protein